MSFVNQVRVTDQTVSLLESAPATHLATHALPNVDASVRVIEGLLRPQELRSLRRDLEAHHWVPVGLDGIQGHYEAGDDVGSWRASVHSDRLADVLWQRIGHLFGPRTFDHMARTDWDGHARWRPVGINPLLRMIKYHNAGLLVPHYDAPYVASHAQRTLVTLVVYLACDADVVGGATRFIADPQQLLPLAQRTHDDWQRIAHENEIIAQVAPVPGSALVFDHRILHDSEPLRTSDGGCKMIMRTDVMYERA